MAMGEEADGGLYSASRHAEVLQEGIVEALEVLQGYKKAGTDAERVRVGVEVLSRTLDRAIGLQMGIASQMEEAILARQAEEGGRAF